MSLLFSGTGAVSTQSLVTGPTIALGNQITYAAWVYITGTGLNDPGVIIRHGGVAGASDLRSQIFIVRNTTRQMVFVACTTAGGGTVAEWRSTATIPINEWHHIAVSFDFGVPGANPIFYYDAAPSTVAGTPVMPTAPFVPDLQVLIVGNAPPPGNSFGFTGRLQDVAVWRRILPHGEIIQMYWGGVFAGFSTAGLGPYYTFRDAPIIDGVDRSWRGWDATLTNTTPAPDANPANGAAELFMVPPTWVTENLAQGLPLPVLSPHSSRNFEGVSTDAAKVILPYAFRPNQITYAAWIKRDGPGRPSYEVWHIVAHGGSGESHIFYGDIDDKLQFNLYTTGSAGGWATDTTIDLNPHHVAMTYDFGSISNQPKFYLDGVLVSSYTTVTPTGVFRNPNTGWWIGQDPGNLHGADGKIQGVTMWNRILTAAEIATVYARGTFAVDHRGLQFYIGPDGRDLSGRGWHATSLGNTTPADPLPEKFPSPEFVEPVWLAKIGDANASGGGTPYYTADRDFAGNDDNSTPTTWDGALVEDPNIDRSTTDTFWGYEELQQTTLKLANHDGKYSALWDKETREMPVKIWRGDGRTGQRHEEFSGMIVRRAREDYHVALECANLDLAAFEEEIPQDTIETREFTVECPAAGETIPALFGNVPKVTLQYVRDYLPGAQFWYLLPTYAFDATVTLYREAPEAAGAGIFEAINPIEYSIFEYPTIPGRRLVGFTKRQEKFGGGTHTIVADITQGPSWNWLRNPVWAIWQIISGLLKRPTDYDLDPNANTWNTAVEAWIAAYPDMGIDGLLDERKPAREYLDELLMICGGRLYFDRVWKISIDAKPTYASIHIRDGLGEGEQNLVTPKSRSVRETKDQISVYKLEHRWDYLKKEYTQVKQRPVWIKGMPKIIQSNFIRQGTLADKVLDRLAKEEQYGSEEMDGELSPEATPVRENQIARATYVGLGLVGDYYRIYKINRQVGTFPVTCRRYHPFMYDYIAAPIDGDPALGTESDYTNVIPSNPVSVFSDNWSTVQMQDGGWEAQTRVDVVTPTGPNFSYTRIDYKPDAGSSWAVGAMISHERSVGATPIGVRVAGLVTGVLYNFRAVTVNQFGIASTGVIHSSTAPIDAVAPSVPGAPGAYPAVGRSVLLVPVIQSDRDLKHWEWTMASATNSYPFGPGFVTYGSTAPGTLLQGWHNIAYDGIPLNTPLYIRMRAIDYSGNASGWGADSAAFSFSNPGTPAIGDWDRAVYLGTDGKAYASQQVGWQAPGASPSPPVEMLVDYIRSGSTEYAGAVVHPAAPGQTFGTWLNELTPGMNYTFRVRARNALGLVSVAATFNATMPGDTTAPAVPTGFGAWPQLDDLFCHCSVAGSDVKAVDWEISNASLTPILHGSVAGVRDGAVEWNIATVVNWIGYGVTHYIRIRAQDYTGNYSGWTGYLAFTYSRRNTSDISPDAVSEIFGAGAPGVYSWPASGLGAFWYTPVGCSVYNGFTTEDLLGYGMITLVNNEGVARLARAKLRNITNGHESLPIEFLLEPYHQRGFTVIGIDTAAAGDQTIQLQIQMEGTHPSQTFAYAQLQVTKMKR